MPSKEVMAAALTTSSTYATRGPVERVQYERRIEALLAAVEPLIIEETRRGVVGQIVDAWAEGEEQCPPLAETIQAIVDKLVVAHIRGRIEPIVSDGQIREIAFQAAGAASRVLLPDDHVMPSEEVVKAVNTILTSFGVATGPDGVAGLEHGSKARQQWTVNGESREFGSERYYPLAPSGSYDSIGWPEFGDVLVVVRHYGASNSSSEKPE